MQPDGVVIDNDTGMISIRFTPTIPHCSMSTLIGCGHVSLASRAWRRIEHHMRRGCELRADYASESNCCAQSLLGSRWTSRSPRAATPPNTRSTSSSMTRSVSQLRWKMPHWCAEGVCT